MSSAAFDNVTFLFTDIEGSTRLWEQYPQAMPAALARHNDIIATAVQQHGGIVFQVIGDAYWAVFPSANAALYATLEAQQALHAEPWRDTSPLKVRMALHTGAAMPSAGGYVGPTVSKLACLVSAGHGGQALLSQATFTALAGQLPDGVSLRDMGERRLRDLPQPEHLYQLLAPGLPSQFPPLKTLDARRTNLPLARDSFVGREAERVALTALLRRPDLRLLTLTGPGGTGKTRLAQQLADDLLEEYDDGVYFVALAAVTDPQLVQPVIAQTLGVKEAAGDSLTDNLRRYLRERQILLLLDNFEQVVDAAPTVAELLTAAPGLKLLVTSREALRIYGEQEYPVPPLALATGNAPLAQSAAVQLFVQRAQAANPDFALSVANAATLVEICTRLDGLPLAIELAAARCRELTPQLMLARWQEQAGDSPLQMLTAPTPAAAPHQQSLRATFDWSYALLTGDEQALFARLSIFAGSYPPAAVAQVCNPPALPAVDTFASLYSLAEKSLLHLIPSSDETNAAAGGESRFTMLAVIHEYAAEKLQQRDEAEAVQRAHCEYYLARVEQAETEIRGPGQARWLAALEAEHDDLRAALSWAMLRDSELLLRLAGALRPFWLMRSYLSEGRYWLETALTEGSGEAALLRAKAALGAGVLAHEQANYLTASVRFEQALHLYQEQGDQRGIANALTNLGLAADEQGDHARARMMLEQALAIWRELDNQAGIASLLGNLGLVVKEQGDYAAAQVMQEESLALRRELKDDWGMAIARDNLGELAFDQGDYASASRHFANSATLRLKLGHRRGLALSLVRFATLAIALGEMQVAARLFGAEEALRETLGVPVGAGDQAEHAHNMALIRHALSDTDFSAAWAVGRAMTLEQAIEYALQQDRAVATA